MKSMARSVTAPDGSSRLARVACRGSLFPWLVVPFSFLACAHTAPPTYPEYGADGPQLPGPKARLALDGYEPRWTENGGGIVYVGNCLTRSSPTDYTIAAIRMLPANGGSATWERCEALHSLEPAPDSDVAFLTAALGQDGRLLYSECTWPRVALGGNGLTCANSGHITVWLSDSAWPFARRRLLFSLYQRVPGMPPDPRTQINDVDDLQWVGPTTFVAIALNLDATLGDTVLGIAVGTIGTIPVLAMIPGTGGAPIHDAAESGTALVITNDSSHIDMIPLPNGARQPVASIPAQDGRVIKSISCHATFCLLLTREPGDSSAFWGLALGTGDITLLGTYPEAINQAQRSPMSSTVLVQRNDGYYLYSNTGTP